MLPPDLLSQCQRKGPDSEFRAFVQKQRSILSNLFSEELESGEGRCIAAHVRRANESGTGFKPSYSCVPLTWQEHNDQHKGEKYCLEKYTRRKYTVEEAKAFFDEKRVEMLMKWLES